MQKRHTDRYRYFREEAATTEKYFIPYLSEFMDVGDISVLEVGCGEGGNLLPFARRGCRVVGVDLSEQRVRQAESFFSRECAAGTFVCDDVMHYRGDGRLFDLIVCHDVVEHIPEKGKMLLALKRLLAPGGRLFVAFPAWQMPFGGHQQIACSWVVSHLPFVHLLPELAFCLMLRLFGEDASKINELIGIRRTRCTVEMFEREAAYAGYTVYDRRLWLVNPHYEVKFGLRPIRLCRQLSALPYIRNFMASSCFYVVRPL
jgi:SAM-dependent methyltransferase